MSKPLAAASVSAIGAILSTTRHKNTSGILVAGNIKSWVMCKEVCGAKMHLVNLNGPRHLLAFRLVALMSDITYMTGQSSTRGLWVRPNTLQTTGLLF